MVKLAWIQVLVYKEVFRMLKWVDVVGLRAHPPFPFSSGPVLFSDELICY